MGAAANRAFLQMCRLLHEYHAEREEPCCILVFLSGIHEIDWYAVYAHRLQFF